MKHKRLTTIEQQRAVEIFFTRMLHDWLHRYKNPVTILDFFAALSALFGCDSTVIHRLTLQTLDSHKFDFPDLAEELNLLYHSGIKVERLQCMYRISKSTVYAHLNKQYEVKLQFTDDERIKLGEFYTALIKFRDEVL